MVRITHQLELRSCGRLEVLVQEDLEDKKLVQRCTESSGLTVPTFICLSSSDCPIH